MLGVISWGRCNIVPAVLGLHVESPKFGSLVATGSPLGSYDVEQLLLEAKLPDGRLVDLWPQLQGIPWLHYG